MIGYNYQYSMTLEEILLEGSHVDDRTGVGTIELFDVNLHADLRSDKHNVNKLPLLTLRKIYPRSMWFELFWMLSGSTDATLMQEKNIKIWDAHSSREFLDSRGLHNVPEGSIGKGYGTQFRNFNGVDQLSELFKGLITNPNSRRHYISLWNPSDLDKSALPPCHISYNFMVTGDTLNLKFGQRSSDFILAGNANMIFASFFLTWVADKLGFKVGSVAHSITNCHVYKNHVEVAKELIQRSVLHHESTFTMPQSGLQFNSVEDVDNNLDKEIAFMWQDSSWETIKNSLHYEHHDAIDPKRLIIAV